MTIDIRFFTRGVYNDDTEKSVVAYFHSLLLVILDFGEVGVFSAED